MVHIILGHFDLNIDFWPHSSFSCLEHISYITANFPKMCLMLANSFGGIRHMTVTFLVLSPKIDFVLAKQWRPW